MTNRLVHRLAPGLLLAALGLAAGCGGPATGPESQPGKLIVFTAVAPEAWLVGRVGGPHVDVHVLVQAGRDPHTFEPTPRQMTALAHARLFFRVGLPLEERLLEKIRATHGQLEVVDVGKGIRRRPMTTGNWHGEKDHESGEPATDHPAGHGVDASGTDPHIWLAPPLVKIQAASIAEALEQVDPAHAEDYRGNLAALLAEADRTDAEIRRLLAPYRGRTIYVFHPSFGYFADAYGLEQEAVEIEGKSPTPRELRELIGRAKAEDVKVVFTQPQFDPRTAQAVAGAVGAQVVTIDPLAEDPLAGALAIARQIAAALGPSGSQAPAPAAKP